MLTRRGKADMATALQQLVQRWRQNADMLAEGNTAEYADPAVGMQRACAADLEAALQPYLREGADPVDDSMLPSAADVLGILKQPAPPADPDYRRVTSQEILDDLRELREWRQGVRRVVR